MFVGPKGKPIRRGNFNKLSNWKKAAAKIGMPGLHVHDLRHTGNTLAARSGASTRDLMTRMGHSSMTAALIYQHATAEADRAIAEGMGMQVKAYRTSKSNESPANEDEAG